MASEDRVEFFGILFVRAEALQIFAGTAAAVIQLDAGERSAALRPPKHRVQGTDIEDRKTAEGKIREQEAELRQIVDLVPQQVAVFGPGGERLYASRVTLDFLGLSLEEWLQIPAGTFSASRFIHPDDRERVARGYSDSIRSG